MGKIATWIQSLKKLLSGDRKVMQEEKQKIENDRKRQLEADMKQLQMRKNWELMNKKGDKQ